MRNKGDQRGGPLLDDRGWKINMARMSPERSLSLVCHAQVAWALSSLIGNVLFTGTTWLHTITCP